MLREVQNCCESSGWACMKSCEGHEVRIGWLQAADVRSG